jgi:hypothetical protein
LWYSTMRSLPLPLLRTHPQACHAGLNGTFKKQTVIQDRFQPV